MKTSCHSVKDESSDVRERAAYALGKMKSEKAVDSLIAALKDEDSYVRWRAAGVLGEIGSEKAVDPLTRTLKDEGETIFGRVKDSAFDSLEKISRSSRSA